MGYWDIWDISSIFTRVDMVGWTRVTKARTISCCKSFMVFYIVKNKIF